MKTKMKFKKPFLSLEDSFENIWYFKSFDNLLCFESFEWFESFECFESFQYLKTLNALKALNVLDFYVHAAFKTFKSFKVSLKFSLINKHFLKAVQITVPTPKRTADLFLSTSEKKSFQDQNNYHTNAFFTRIHSQPASLHLKRNTE